MAIQPAPAGAGLRPIAEALLLLPDDRLESLAAVDGSQGGLVIDDAIANVKEAAGAVTAVRRETRVSEVGRQALRISHRLEITRTGQAAPPAVCLAYRHRAVWQPGQ